jgi:Phosphotransferase enzyme family
MKLNQAALETLLSEAFGVPVHISRFDRLTPWYVVRCHLEHASSSLPESIIVKGLREDPNGFRTDPQQVLTEKAALEFLAELGVHITPRLLASDSAANILVLEDLAPRVPLAAILQSADTERAKVGLSAFARALGTLSAATVGHEDTYYAKRRALGSVDPQAERERFLGNGWTETRGYAEALGVSASGEVETEMATVVAEIAHPGAFLSFSNGDAGSNNFLVENGDGRIIDFEFAGYRHALTDAVCLYVPGPIWLTVSDPITSGLETEYRAALCRSVPQVADDRRFGFGLAAACMAFAIERLNRFPVIDGRGAGDQSRLHRIATLESAAAVAESRGALRHLARWARRLGEVLRRRWPEADVDLTVYEPYTPRR